MKRLRVLTCGVLLSGLWVAAAAAADECLEPAAPAQVEEQVTAPEEAAAAGATVTEGVVPEAQVELFRKREAAKQRRDKLLRLRATTSQSE